MKRACVLFGERVKGLRRAGVAVDAIPASRWCELFQAACAQPVLWQACDEIVRAMADAPDMPVAALVAGRRLGVAPDDWRERARAAVVEAAGRLYRASRSQSPKSEVRSPRSTSDIGHRTSDDSDRLFRFAMGLAMRDLRGRVPALDVAQALRTETNAR